jgi:hypothetical protein
MSNSDQKQNDILAECIRHDATGELHRAEERIHSAECEERCVRRAMWLMAILTAVAAAGLAYSVILLYEVAPYYTRILNHIFTVVAVASLLSLVAFAFLWVQRRHRLSARREEVRRLVMKLLAARNQPQSAGDRT